MDWKGNIIMTSLQDDEKHFIIKKEKWYSNILVMKDENEKVYFHLKRNFNPNSAIEKKEYFSILISNCVAVEKNKR